MILEWAYCLLLLMFLKAIKKASMENNYFNKLFNLKRDEFCNTKKEQKISKEAKRQGK